MIQYILEVLAFQLLFLVVYDLFLKKETFFNWNRIYLIATSLVSLLIPFVKFSAITTAIPEQYTYVFPVFESLQEIVITGEESSGFNYQFQWEHLFYLGMVISFGFLLFKLCKINILLRKGKVVRLSNYTKVLLLQSKQAFSFFKYIFLGDAIVDKEHEKIIEHELVHVRQKHSVDLLYFEILRVIFWFNPLIYIYQNRIAELHEFIADAKTVKTNKQDYVNELLSQTFQVQHISFVNQFLKPSLLKKRLKMISRKQSKSVFKLKYLSLVPLVFTMLVYNSCEQLDKEQLGTEALKESILVDNLLSSKTIKESTPFAVVEQVPIFPSCENTTDKRACFQEKIQEHIRENFRYPPEAQAQNIEGRVYVNFVISTDGTIENLRMRGPDIRLESEVERIIKKLPQFIPGKQGGKFVNVPFSIPITFKLHNDKNADDSLKNYSDKLAKKEGEKTSEHQDRAIPFAIIDKAPIFPGCENDGSMKDCFNEKFNSHIRKHFNYPNDLKEKGIEGNVYIMLEIGKTGKLNLVRTRAPDPRLDAAARKIIEQLPVFEPGMHKGKAVRVIYSTKITYSL